MANNTATPYYLGPDFSCHAQAAVTGKRFVTVAGAMVGGRTQVKHAVGAVTNRAIGVAAYDAPVGAGVSVWGQPGLVVPVTAGEAITAGDLVYSAADGRAVKTQPAGALVVGVALNDAATGADCPVRLA